MDTDNKVISMFDSPIAKARAEAEREQADAEAAEAARRQHLLDEPYAPKPKSSKQRETESYARFLRDEINEPATEFGASLRAFPPARPYMAAYDTALVTEKAALDAITAAEAALADAKWRHKESIKTRRDAYRASSPAQCEHYREWCKTHPEEYNPDDDAEIAG